MSGYVVGVDGGGSRTRALLLDGDGAVAARWEGGPSAVDPRKPEACVRTVGDGVRALAEEAGVPLPVAALSVGLAGAGRIGVRETVARALEGAGLARRVHVETDAEAAFRDAFGTGPGILLVAGTGSVAWGRGPRGRRDRVGGWGPLLGDEGSGYALGLEALRRVARAVDGRGPATALAETLPRILGSAGPEELVDRVAGADRRQVAGLVPALVEAADAGDVVAGSILHEGAEALAHQVHVLRDRLGPWGGPTPLALAGGLLASDGPLRGRLEDALDAGPWRLHERRVDAARGAARALLDLGLHD